MKLFAPKNNWDMRSSESWWPYIGGTRTVTGKFVSEETALKFSAVFAATRIISETLASLPLNTLEQVDSRTQNKATAHPLWKLLHDVPNPEQDSMTFFDQQTAFMVNWGNAYAEKQVIGGEIAALWPIHPSRIPLCNIRRNPSEGTEGWRDIVAGQPGEIVYWVKNDDGTTTPIPASDMLHVPGVLSSNGITGQGIIQWAANSIGISIATEEHAGAFFRNGAMAHIALLSDKKVGQDTAERLRVSWQQTYGGTANHYKALLCEDGIKPMPIDISPENSQLLDSRQFGVTEIARWYRLPPHLLADLTHATLNNIEEQNLSFVTHAMLPWIVRWERAMYRQLLTPFEKESYRFKFNVNGLLRGNTAARAQFYTAMFQMGAFSPNDIRSLEDQNPIEGGDQYFVPGNNLVPLDKAGELAQAQIDAANKPDPAPQQPDPNAGNHQRLVELRKLQEELIFKVELRDAAEERAAEFRKRFDAIEGRQAESANTTATKADVEHVLTAQREAVEQAVAPITEQVRTVTDRISEIDRNQEILGKFEAVFTKSEQIEAKIDAIQPVVESVAELKQKVESQRGDEIVAEQIQVLRADVADQLKPIAEKVDAVPALVTQAVNDLAKQAAEARDTSESEEIAAKRAEIERISAEIEEKRRIERETTDRLLAFTLQRGIERMAGREANAIAGAREEPRGFTEWRTGFYKTFLRLFEHELDGFVSDFELCGVVIDPKWGADRYVGESISDLKTLDETAKDNHYDRLKAATDNFVKVLWTERAKKLTDEMISRGRRLFDEKKEKQCTN